MFILSFRKPSHNYMMFVCIFYFFVPLYIIFFCMTCYTYTYSIMSLNATLYCRFLRQIGWFLAEVKIRFFLCNIYPTVTTRILCPGPRDVWPLQALSDGERHGREGECFLHHWHRHCWGDWKHLGIARPRATAGEPPRPLPHPHLTGEATSCEVF